MDYEFVEDDDWKNAAKTIALSDSLISGYESLIARIRSKLLAAFVVAVVLSALFLLCIGLLTHDAMRWEQFSSGSVFSSFYPFLPAITLLVAFALISTFVQLANLREVLHGGLALLRQQLQLNKSARMALEEEFKIMEGTRV